MPETETITFHWHREWGDCYECGLPAAFYVPNEYGEGDKPTEHNKRCSVCAANDAADGCEVRRIEEYD